jgi:hypothetical protein
MMTRWNTGAERAATLRNGGPQWTYRSSTMQGLSFSFDIQCTERTLGLYLDSLLVELRVKAEAAHTYSLVSGPGNGVQLLLDDRPLARMDDGRSAIAQLLCDINQRVVEASPQHLLFHAGGVQAGAAGILLPAPSGSGKSTLVAGLVGAGLDYLSDEVVGLSFSGGQLLPYPKPLTLKDGSFGVLRHLQPDMTSVSADFLGPEWHVGPAAMRPDAIGSPCAPTLVVVPHYAAGSITALRPLARAEAFLALAVNTVNLDSHGAQGTELLGQLVERCDCYLLEMSDLAAAVELVLGLE